MWWALAAMAVAGSVWVLADAVADLAGEPSFAAVLRLAVEAVAAGLVTTVCVRQAQASARRRRPARAAASDRAPRPGGDRLR